MIHHLGLFRESLIYLSRLNRSKGQSDASNYRPITCLSNIWKLLTRIIGNSIYSHFNVNSLFSDFSPNQKGNWRGVWGTKEHLLVDKMIMYDSHRQRTNLAMCWIDYKKAFDSVPHAWILSVLNLYKVSPTIVKFFEKSMATWRTVLKAGPSVIGMVSIRSGIFHGDVISPLLFCIALAPLSFSLEREKLGYSLREGPVINHLLYMDDLKLFAKSEQQLETLVQITHNFSASMGIQFGFQKCASVIMQRGRQCSSSGITLPDGLIAALKPLECYKYLGIYEADSINCSKAKEIV